MKGGVMLRPPPVIGLCGFMFCFALVRFAVLPQFRGPSVCRIGRCHADSALLSPRSGQRGDHRLPHLATSLSADDVLLSFFEYGNTSIAEIYVGRYTWFRLSLPSHEETSLSHPLRPLSPLHSLLSHSCPAPSTPTDRRPALPPRRPSNPPSLPLSKRRRVPPSLLC